MRFTLNRQPTVPLEAEVLSPDVIAPPGADPLPVDEVRALPVYLGKRKYRVDEFFGVDGEPGAELAVCGDARRVKWLGRGMTHGRLMVDGNAGMHLAAFMKGGTVEVTGNAGDWVGAEMTGGVIRIRGNAGGQIGAAYRGSPSGMSGGTVVVDGTAGMEIGMRMRRGTIAVKGRVRDFAGLQMKGGTIVLGSGAEIRTGAWMARGTIISLQPLRLLPTFSAACVYTPPFLPLLARHLRSFGVDLPVDPREGGYLRHTGDAAIPGKGEILVWRPQAG